MGCKDTSETSDPIEEIIKKLPVEETAITGRYVTDFYELRSEGYDWMVINVSRVSEDEISLKVRSRADKKKPTCTFDSHAYKLNDSVFTTSVQGKPIRISFSKHSVSITAEKQEDESALYFYCSGGATLAGTYHKIYDPIDTSQIDKTTFSQNYQFQGVGFSVSAKPINGTQQELVVNPSGLELMDQAITQTMDGIVVNAEVEDLDSDGSPEIIVYTQSGPHKTGNVFGYSVLQNKSMVMLYFPPTADNKEINQGYEGQDSFTLMENNLAQRFPLFKNGQPTGKIRQVSYQLENGEAYKVFVIKNKVDVTSDEDEM